jgi:hypothetical protein
MIVKRNTWHYRAWEFYHRCFGTIKTRIRWKRIEPTNLCSYIRVVILYNLINLTWVVGCYGIAAYALFYLATAILAADAVILSGLWMMLWVMLGMVALFSIVAIVVLGIFGITKATETVKRLANDNILFQYVKAKKTKVCPLIEVERY